MTAYRTSAREKPAKLSLRCRLGFHPWTWVVRSTLSRRCARCGRGDAPEHDGDDGGGGFWLLLLLVAAALGGGLYVLFWGKR